MVSNQFGVALSLTAPLSLQYPPQITQQPIGGLQLIGSNFTFSVTATGTDPLNYQWQFYGTNIIDANSTNLIRTNLSLADSGVYSVVVSNFLGSVTSSVASLNVVSVMPQVYYGFNLYGNWSQYLYSYTNAEVYSEQSAGTATYWRPTVAGTEGDIIYRFPFVNPLAQATLTAGIAVWTMTQRLIWMSHRMAPTGPILTDDTLTMAAAAKVPTTSLRLSKIQKRSGCERA